MEGYDLLVVDDQAGVRRLLYEAFSAEGYRVELAATGPEAIQKAAAKVPDVILLDNKMPVMSGLEAARELGRLCPGVPIVLMTAYGEMNVAVPGQKLGILHYIDKPFDLNEVRQLVKALLVQRRYAKKYMERTG
ncbi:MAG: response regulator [Armatimonadetes bacterium]|nr:response regulator [Armatimonadota bacterium]